MTCSQSRILSVCFIIIGRFFMESWPRLHFQLQAVSRRTFWIAFTLTAMDHCAPVISQNLCRRALSLMTVFK